MIDVCKQAESGTTLICLELAAMAPVLFEAKVEVRRLIPQLSLGLPMFDLSRPFGSLWVPQSAFFLLMSDS